MRTCIVILLAAASAAAFTPAPPVSRWGDARSPMLASVAPFTCTDEFDRVRVDTMISAQQYSFMPKQAVLASAGCLHGDPTFFLGYGSVEGAVRTAVFPESHFDDPSLWVREDVHDAGGQGTVRDACPSTFWSDSAGRWYSQVVFSGSTPPSVGFKYDQGGIGAGIW
ncbi:hypothetical protein JXA88_03900 [Candidatus Fermentibacteria bacterium]|nr:hypothetical protein [Candidatus Fermentibacteria bacterium]